MPQGPCSPWGQLLRWHPPQVVGIRHLQRVVLLHAEHGGPLHTHQHTLAAASQQEHLDLQGKGSRLQESQAPAGPPSPRPLALPPCWLLSGVVGAAAGWRSPGLSQSHKGAPGCRPALPGTGTGSAGTGQSRVSSDALGGGRTGQSQHEGEGGAQGSQPCLLLEEKDDPIVGHEPQLLVKALCVAGLLFKADAGEAAAIQVGAIREPRVTSGLGAAH